MRYVLKFITIILPRPTKFCQYFILLIENLNLYSDEDGVKHICIKARPNKWHENDCPFCHKSCPAYDKHSSRPTTWRGLDWGGILVEVEYQTHRIICLEHGVYVAEVPWAYPGSRFTKDFDLTVAWFASYLPRSTTSYFMRVDWETVGRCVNRALHDLEPERSRILVVILTSHLLFILIVAVNMCQLRGVKPLKQCREVILTAVILMITLASNRSTP